MSILDFLLKAGAAGQTLVDLLNRVRAVSPELAPEVDKVLAQLQAAIDPANLAALSTVILSELKDIGQGTIDPREHPSDVA